MTAIIQPGSTIGILGGGQLGRMLTVAAKTMGYRVYALDPNPDCSARSLVDRFFQASFDNVQIAGEMARECNVVTLEIEQISVDVLRAVEQVSLMRPGSRAVHVIQNRIRQKEWLVEHGFPVGPYQAVRSYADISKAVDALGSSVFLKGALGGFDGRSQERLSDCSELSLATAWSQLGRQPCVAERLVPLEAEISVMVSRSPQGEVKTFPPASNYHEQQILLWSVLPAMVDAAIADSAGTLALQIAEALSFEGSLAVEMFLSSDGQLLINELAPRPHNSYHASEQACATSQFEQTIRAICNLPLGDVDIITPTAIVNLLGDIWQSTSLSFDRALKHSGVRVHLYGKSEARKGRKMGHLSSIGGGSQEAVDRVLLAYRDLSTK